MHSQVSCPLTAQSLLLPRHAGDMTPRQNLRSASEGPVHAPPRRPRSRCPPPRTFRAPKSEACAFWNPSRALLRPVPPRLSTEFVTCADAAHPRKRNSDRDFQVWCTCCCISRENGPARCRRTTPHLHLACDGNPQPRILRTAHGHASYGRDLSRRDRLTRIRRFR